MLPLLGMASGLLGGLTGGGGAAGAIPGMSPPAGDADASAAAGFGMVAPTLNQSFGSGNFYAKTSPVMETDATIKGGMASAGAGQSPATGGIQPTYDTTAGTLAGIPYPLLILGAVAIIAVLFKGKN